VTKLNCAWLTISPAEAWALTDEAFRRARAAPRPGGGDGEALPDGVAVADGAGDADALGDGLTLPDGDGEGAGEEEGVGDGEGDADADGHRIERGSTQPGWAVAAGRMAPDG
jgi:hypothetical protein